MRYLVTTLYFEPFLTDVFTVENNWNSDTTMGMVVFDLSNKTYMTDGENWMDIKEDQL